MAKYMNSTVELLLLDKEDFYKKKMWQKPILKDFFSTNQTKDFTIGTRELKNEAQYAIGILRPKR
jgi:hypothetical protein